MVQLKRAVQRRGHTGEHNCEEESARSRRGLRGPGRRRESEGQGEEGSRWRGGEKQMRRRAGECFIDSLLQKSWLP